MATPSSRRPSPARWLVVLVPVLLAGAGATWWFAGSRGGHVLSVSDARGIQPGDAVVRSGVRVGEVVGVRAAEGAGARVEFRMAAGETLQQGDLVRVERGLLSARSELAVLRPCATAPPSTGESARAPRELDEADRITFTAARVRCSPSVQWMEERLSGVDTEAAVQAFRETWEEARERGGPALAEGREFLMERGEQLMQRLRDAGLHARADSIRQMLEGGGR